MLIVQEEFRAQVKSLERRLVEAENGTQCASSEIVSRPLLPTVKPPTYDGQTVWTSYRAQFDVIAEVNNWDERTKACQLVASLRGPATDILQTLPADKRVNFTALVNALELRYGERNLKETCRIQIRSRRQKPGESLQELASEVERLSQLAFADCPAEVRESLAVQYFTDAIRDPDVQQAVIMGECENINSALALASKFEVARQASRNVRPVRGAAVSDTSPDSQEILSILKELLTRSRKSEEETPRKQIVCWTCGVTGHLRRNCPNNSRDTLKEKTFERRFSGKLEPSDLAGRKLLYGENAPVKISQISSLQGGDHGLYVMGLINAVQSKLIIDTGANVTIVRTDVALQAKGEALYTAPSVSLRTVTGDAVAVHGRMKVSITIGARTYHHIVYMADIADPCILGLDFLMNNEFELDFRNKEIHAADEDIPLFGLASKTPNYRIVTKEDKNISPQTESIANGRVEGPTNFKLAVTDFPSTENDIRGIRVAASLVDITKDTVPVRVANISNKTKIIRKREKLASCVPVTSVMYDCRKVSLHQSEYLKDLKGDSGDSNSVQEDVAQKLSEEFSEIFSSSSTDVDHTKIIQHRINIASDRMKTQYDSNSNVRIFKDGDKVWFFNPRRRRGLCPKLQQNWEGPYIVVKKLNSLVYRIQKSPSSKPRVVHVDRLAPYKDSQDTARDVQPLRGGQCNAR